MPTNRLQKSLRLGLQVTRTTVDLSVRVAGRATELVSTLIQSRISSTPTPAPASSAGTGRPLHAVPSPEPAPAPVPLQEAPLASPAVASYDDQPATPIDAEQARAKTIDDQDEVVAEFAEPGAEDGAGAQVELDAPWEGYDQMDAKSIADRVRSADTAQVAIVELYEQAHKGRKTVLEAARRQLRRS